MKYLLLAKSQPKQQKCINDHQCWWGHCGQNTENIKCIITARYATPSETKAYWVSDCLEMFHRGFWRLGDVFSFAALNHWVRLQGTPNWFASGWILDWRVGHSNLAVSKSGRHGRCGMALWQQERLQKYQWAVFLGPNVPFPFRTRWD